MRSILLFAVLAILPCAGRAQCTTSVSFQSYGSGCNTVSGQVPALSGSFDTQTCTVSLTLTGFPGCCNTFLVGRVFFLGGAQVNTPLPGIGPGCALLARPDLPVAFATGAEDTLRFAVPDGFPALTLYSQGANVYFTTIGFGTDVELSQGLALVFS